jgi:hypothetical protein
MGTAEAVDFTVVADAAPIELSVAYDTGIR